MLPHIAKIALMIDADNISPKAFPSILEIPRMKGEILYFFIAGKENSLKAWAAIIEKYRFNFEKAPAGKDVADNIILKYCVQLLLYHREIDTFCIVSNDVGFALTRDFLRSQGKSVFVVGKTDAAKPLRNDFEFYPLQTTPDIPAKTLKLMKLVEQAFASQNEEWVNLSLLKTMLQGIQPDFQEKDYEVTRFSELLETVPEFIELKKVGLLRYARIIKRKTKN